MHRGTRQRPHAGIRNRAGARRPVRGSRFAGFHETCRATEVHVGAGCRVAQQRRDVEPLLGVAVVVVEVQLACRHRSTQFLRKRGVRRRAGAVMQLERGALLLQRMVAQCRESLARAGAWAADTAEERESQVSHAH